MAAGHAAFGHFSEIVCITHWGNCHPYVIQIKSGGSVRHRFVRIAAFWAILVTSMLLLPSPAWAILAELTLPELVQMADHIVQGRVLQTSAAWNESRTQILTTVIISIDDVYAGNREDSSEVTVICPGGVVDSVAMEVEHSPVFLVNERVVVFLTDIDRKTSRVSGWEAGKFTIHNDRISENGMPLTQFTKQIANAVKLSGRR